MKYQELSLKSAYVVELEPIRDERGFFSRVWSSNEFASLGFNSTLAQQSLSFNQKKGTLRGMHFQIAPFEEIKIVQCTRGSIYDVIVDLRADSPTFGQWQGVELSAKNRRILYIPPQFGHGFQTLEDDTDVLYQMSQPHSPSHARGYRYDDPFFKVQWPLPVTSISQKDLQLPTLDFLPARACHQLSL